MASLHRDPNYIKGREAITRGICKGVAQYVLAICTISYYSLININIINSAGKRDRICVLFPSDKLLITNRPKAAAEGSGLRPLSYPRNGRGPLPKAAARAPLGFAAL